MFLEVRVMQLFFVLYNVLSTVVCLSTPFCLGTKWLIIVAFRNLIYEYSITICFPKNVFKYFHWNNIFLKPRPTKKKNKQNKKTKQNKKSKKKQAKNGCILSIWVVLQYLRIANLHLYKFWIQIIVLAGIIP